MTVRSRKIIKAFSISSVIMFFLAIGIVWYLYSQFQSGKFDSLLKRQLQQVLNDNHIPIEIKSLKLQLDPKEFVQGKIKLFDVELLYKPLQLPVHLTTPVFYELKTDSLHLEIEPKILSKNIPDFYGKIVSDIRFERNKSEIKIQNIESKINIKSLEPIQYQLSQANIQLDSLITSIYINLNLVQSPKANISFESIANHPQISFQNIELEDQKFNLMFHANLENDILNFSEIRIQDPIAITSSGKLKNIFTKPDLDFNFQLKYSFKKLITKLRKIINLPILKQIETSGTLNLKGELSGPIESVDLDSVLKIQTDEFKINKMYSSEPIIQFKKLDLSIPLYFPLDEANGMITAESFLLFNSKFNKLNIHFISHPEYIELLLLNPLNTTIFENKLNIDQFEVHIPFYPETSEENETKLPFLHFPVVVKSKMSGGPFQISTIQKEMCILNQKPIEGEMKFEFPKVFNSKEGFHALGSIDVSLLGGTAQIRDVRYYWGEDHPKVSFQSRWDDLDLNKIGELTKFGDMRGSLDGSLNNATYAITDIGPIPLEYDFTVQGKPRSGKVIRFYGRAVDNILELLGSRKQEMPWYAQWFINMSMSFRNYFPATADYMGFRAKTESGWTELYTFDPPTSANSEEKEKLHYILSGTAFKIPLNTHGVYPAIMKTEAFQGWLWGMVDYFRKLSEEKNHVDNTNECTPFWKR